MTIQGNYEIRLTIELLLPVTALWANRKDRPVTPSRPYACFVRPISQAHLAWVAHHSRHFSSSAFRDFLSPENWYSGPSFCPVRWRSSFTFANQA